MYFTYALASCNHKFVYVGMTANLANRLYRHQKGYEKATKAYRPFILIYWEILEESANARKRERYLKGRSGKRVLYQVIKKHSKKLTSAGLSSWLYFDT